MATIVERSNKRNRVQFTVTCLLHNEYQRCLELAEKLTVSIDFSRDFERWFGGQLDQVSRELVRIEAGRSVKIPEIIPYINDAVVSSSVEPAVEPAEEWTCNEDNVGLGSENMEDANDNY